jgi:hypothetical protein
MQRARVGIMAAALLGVASPATAQLWEVHLGAVGTYGTADAHGAGIGPVIGVMPGRLAYAGLRWTYFAGTTATDSSTAPATDIRNHAQTLSLDLGLVIPKGPIEVIPGVGIGLTRFAQDTRASGSGAAWETFTTTELLVTPGIAVQIPLGRVSVIPEIQYGLCPHPRLPFPMDHQGLLLSVRTVITFETDRIRQ